MQTSRQVHEERRITTRKQTDASASYASHNPSLSTATLQRTAQDSSRLAPQEVMAWQRSAGNRAVAGLLGRNTPAQVPAIQRTPVGPEGGALQGDVESRLRRAQGSGRSLPDRVRSTLEPKLGADLGSVKVHTGPQAVQLTREMGAKAFTHKNHIYYGAGHSPNDLKLTAHETVHTIQQGAVKQQAQRKQEDKVSHVAKPQIARTPVQIQRFGLLDKLRRRNRPMTDQDLVNHTQGDGGSLNRVDKVSYKRGIGGSRAKKGYFKPDTRQGMSDKAVASSRLAKWLGMDVVSEEVYAQHGKEKGSVSADLRETMPNVQPLNEKMYDVLAQNQNPDFEDPESDEYGAEMDWRQDDQGQWYTYGGDRHYEHDLHNPVTQKGLSDLQLFDAISAQDDRHGGNIYIDPMTGKVRAIDHDISFGVGQKGLDTTWGKYHGLPSQVDKRTAKRILKRKAKNLPKVLRSKEGGLTDDEIKVAQERFRAVKAYVRQQKKDKKLVKKWDNSTYQSALNEANHTEGKRLERSYLKRTMHLRGQAHERKPVNSQGLEWASSDLYDNSGPFDHSDESEVEEEGN